MKKRSFLKSHNAWLGLFLIASCLVSQTPPIKQEARNTTCSNVIALAGNVNINCSHLNPTQEKLIASIPAVLKKIITNQLDPELVMAKLNEIQNGVDQIRQLTADRSISEIDVQRLIDILKVYKGQRAEIQYLQADNETERFAEKIREILIAAEWSVPNKVIGMMRVSTAPLLGINVTARTSTPAALAILNALNGMFPGKVHGYQDSQVADGLIQISVLNKR